MSWMWSFRASNLMFTNAFFSSSRVSTYSGWPAMCESTGALPAGYCFLKHTLQARMPESFSSASIPFEMNKIPYSSSSTRFLIRRVDTPLQSSSHLSGEFSRMPLYWLITSFASGASRRLKSKTDLFCSVMVTAMSMLQQVRDVSKTTPPYFPASPHCGHTAAIIF